MTTDLEMDIAPEQGKQTLDIGQILRAKRLAAGVSERQVATELKLSIEHVSALENNAFDHFRSATFARGYLKSYCRLTGIDHRPMLEAFDVQQSVKESNLRPVDNVQPQASGRDPIFVIVSAIIVAIIVFVVFWWPTQNTEDDISVTDPVEEQAIESSVNETPDLVGEPETLAEESEAEVEVPVMSTEETTEVDLGEADIDLSALPEAVQQDVDDAQVVTGLSAETIALLEDAGVDPEQVVEATRESETPIIEEAPVPAAPSHDIMIQFDADCWTEIRDSSGRILFSGVKRAGTSLELDGQAPYRVTLGYARGVQEFLYKGEPFDFSSYIRKDLARFELE